MQLVIDASIVLAVALNQAERPELLHSGANAELLAPESLEWEVGNALSSMLKRNELSENAALGVVKLYRAMNIQLVPVSLEESVRLTAFLRIYAYDAYMIRCAQEFLCPLITLDNGLRNAAKKVGVHVIEVKP